MFSPSEFYLIYPSWRFAISFNIVAFEGVFDVEGNHGSQRGIAQGTENPEFSFRVNDASLRRSTIYIGELTDEIGIPLRRVMSHFRKLDWSQFYTEVAVTTKKEILFYELFPVFG